MVYEDLAARIANDEAKSLGAVEPFHDACFTFSVRVGRWFVRGIGGRRARRRRAYCAVRDQTSDEHRAHREYEQHEISCREQTRKNFGDHSAEKQGTCGSDDKSSQY